jgi:hypothetical protein
MGKYMHRGRAEEKELLTEFLNQNWKDYTFKVYAKKNRGCIMDWFKEHTDTFTIIASFALCFWNMNEKMNENIKQIDKQFAEIHQELAVMKTVLIMKNLMPAELAQSKGIDE